MSLDLELYSSRNVTLDDLRAGVPHVDAWRAYGGDVLAYEAVDWQLLVSAAEEVEPLDVPGDLLELLPAARYRIGFTLEPISASSEALTFLGEVVGIVGGRFDCVGSDIQAGSPRRYLPTSSANVARPQLLDKQDGTPEERRRRENPEQDLARFLLDEAEKLPALIREASRAGVAADSTILTLAGFLEWISRRVTTVQGPVPDGVAPELRDSIEGAFRRLDERSLALVRTTAYHVGETFRASFPHLRWAVGEAGFYQEGEPVITGFAHALELDVLNVTTNVVLAEALDAQAGRIRTVVDAWVRHAVEGAAA